ncbi:MAG: PAAR domain-containing protein [Acidobacteriaceae bacterium]
MGTPACRISDETEHGGVIVMGFPTVLIGGLPAARIGDNHVCPMETPGVPPIPHVGGPFVMGSPTVLVGEMPQSRVTDQLVCVGPPDMAILGEETVLVGMAGAGGMAGAMGGLQSMGVPVPMQPSFPSVATATLLSDGTMLTSAPPGRALPPIPLSQAGWPDLPPESTASFESVQPVILPPGTTLFAPDDAGVSDSTASTQKVTAVAPGSDGVRAWIGKPAGSPPGAPQRIWIAPQTAPQTASSAGLRQQPSARSGL